MSSEKAETLLLTAIFVRAVRDLVAYSKGKSPEEQRIAKSAREWLFEGTAEDEHITSFHNICLVMDLDSERVKKKLLQLMSEETIESRAAIERWWR